MNLHKVKKRERHNAYVFLGYRGIVTPPSPCWSNYAKVSLPLDPHKDQVLYGGYPFFTPDRRIPIPDTPFWRSPLLSYLGDANHQK